MASWSAAQACAKIRCDREAEAMSDGVPRKRSTYVLTPETYQVVADKARSLRTSDNAAINACLIELLEWRAGMRRAVRRPRQIPQAAPRK